MLQLSARAFVSMHMIRKVEAGGPVPRRTSVAVRAALEAAGVEFVVENGGGAVVQLRKDPADE
ncbi:MAG: XRE family transcriptional regulator [Alphaproteobacteria bacterium]|nr:MAG: XRE family transcriptional regulator [Alphaproteobacteria bacterium]